MTATDPTAYAATERKPSYVTLAVFIALCAATASTGALFAPGLWYEALVKPSWNPPNWLFGPVWSVLYVMISIAAWMLWNARGWSFALALWLIQLVLNALWSGLFFGLQRPDIAFYEVITLALCVLALVFTSARIRKATLWLLTPYLMWVLFAGYLNFVIWQLNA